jgi:phosphoserine aminotransferase
MLNLRDLIANGGVEAAAARNKAKADALYAEIDSNPSFKGTVPVEDRSIMNITFLLNDEADKDAFDKLWNDAEIVGLKGHRSVGGYRASMYNALTLESVQALTAVMSELTRSKG